MMAKLFFTINGCLIAAAAPAQSHSIDWHIIAAGGGASTGGDYTLAGTIGQPVASASIAGGSFSLTGGFWSIGAVQTPGAPLINIFLTATNTAVISWPAAATGFTLQQNSQLGTSNWTAAGPAFNDNGTYKFIVSPPTGNRYYRLVKP
jgi:hypothetical protein